MAITAIRIICCVLYGTASFFDERERMIPRIIGISVCGVSLLGWCIQFYLNKQFSIGNLLISAGFFGILFIFYMKGQIGLGDLFLVFSMLTLLSCGQPAIELLWKENLLFCIAFLSAAIRIFVQRFYQKYVKKQECSKGCPFALHLFVSFLITGLS